MPKRVEVVDRVQVAHSKLLEGFSCTAVVAYLAETKRVSRRTAQRTVQQACALNTYAMALPSFTNRCS